MKSAILMTSLLVTAVAGAKELSKKLPAICEQQIVDVVFDKLGRYDETFSVAGYSVIYTNHFNGLAVVRTSDEVEPRDVLVSVRHVQKETGDTCTVKYMQTIADGSTADLDDVLVDLGQSPRTIAAKHFELNATIVSVVTGEIHPYVIGDACLIEVKDEDGQVTGLVTDQYECDEASDKIKAGAKLTAQIHKSDRIKKKAELAELKSMFKASRYYNVPFSQISVQ